MLEESESKKPAMNPFQKNESKETLFSPVSTEEVPPRLLSLPKKPTPVSPQIPVSFWQEQNCSFGSTWPLDCQAELY